MAAGLGNIGRGFYERHELDSAATYWARSAEVAERLGDFRTAGNAVGNLASVAAMDPARSSVANRTPGSSGSSP